MTWQQTDKDYIRGIAMYDTQIVTICASASASTWYHSFSSLRNQKMRCLNCGGFARFIDCGSDEHKSWEEYQCERCGYRFKVVFRSVRT